MFKLPSFKKTKATSNEPLIVLELGTGSIKTGLYLMDEKKVEGLGYAHREIEKYNPAYLYEENIEDLVEKTQDLIQSIKSYSDAEPKNITIGIPAIKLVSQTTTVRFKRVNSDKKITSSELDKFTEKILNKAKKDALEEYKKISANYGGDLEIVNSDISFIKLDGYITKNLEGLKGSTLEISLFSSFAPSEYLNKIVNFSNKLDLNLITVVSNIYAVNKATEKEETDNHITLNIGDKNTDAAVVFANEILKIVSTNIGQQDIVSYTNLSNNEEEEKLYKQEITDIWIKSLASVLNSIKEVKVYPSKILTVYNAKQTVDIELFINKIDDLRFKNDPYAEKISKDKISGFMDHTNEMEDKYIICASIAIFSKSILN